MAGVAGVVLALLTLAATVPGGSTPNSPPANAWASTYAPPQQEPGSSPAAVPSQLPLPGSNQSDDGPPAGCRQGEAAVTTYEEADKPNPYGKANAAERAMSGIQGAVNSGADGIVRTDLVILYNDFGPLLGSADNPDYAMAEGAIQTDSRQLWKDCG